MPDRKQTAVIDTGAVIDRSGLYRYRLWRRWDVDLPVVAFLMLNPSTADASSNDQTIRTCIRLSMSKGYGALEVVNLFALRATDPAALKMALDPVGRRNDAYIVQACERADALVLAWGNHGLYADRAERVFSMIARTVPDKPALCLGRTKLGQPRHPLYTRLDAQLLRYTSPYEGQGLAAL